MNTRRLVATIVSTAAVTAVAVAGVAPAQAEIGDRIDAGGSGNRTPVTSVVRGVVVEGDSIRISSLSSRTPVTSMASAVVIEGDSIRIPSLSGRASGGTGTTSSDVRLWSYADDGTLELHVNGVTHRHHGRLLQ